MGATVKLSIGIATYNSEKWIAKTLNSLLVQTFSDFEIIVSDNASTDQTYGICCDIASRDHRIRLYRNNKNIGCPRNQDKLRDYAHSEYFMWSSSSDLYAPNYLERCFEAFEKIPDCVLSAAKTIFIDENDSIITRYEEDMSLLDDNPVNRFIGFLEKVTYNNVFCGIIKKSILDNSTVLGLHIGDEYPLMVDLALRGKYFQIDEYLCYNRLTSETFCMKMNERSKANFFYPNKTTLPYLHEIKYYLHLIKVILSAKLAIVDKCKLVKVTMNNLYYFYQKKFLKKHPIQY